MRPVKGSLGHFPYEGMRSWKILAALRVKMSETVSDVEFTEQGEQGFSG